MLCTREDVAGEFDKASRVFVRAAKRFINSEPLRGSQNFMDGYLYIWEKKSKSL
jgi:hypothetical protein